MKHANAFRIFIRRLAALARSTKKDSELDDEITSHLAEAMDEYLAKGVSREEARLAALRDFGGVTQTRETHREVRSFTSLEAVGQDLKYAFRRLIQKPAFTGVAVATLTLGIGANTAIFALLDAVLFKPLPVPAPHELVTFYETGPEGKADLAGGTGSFLRFSYPRFERLREALGSDGSIAAVTRSSTLVVQLPGVTQAQFVAGQLVSGDYFATLGVPAARGRALSPDDVRLDGAAPVAVVSDGFWKRVLGASDAAIGRTLTVNGVSVTVVGVMPPGFFGTWSDSEAHVWLPISLQRELRHRSNTTSYGQLDADRSWLSQDLIAWVNVVARVPAGTLPSVMPRLQAANQQGIRELAAQLTEAEERTAMAAHALALDPFSDGFSGLRNRYSDALFALTALVALVLLVTCANLANLLLARGAGEARDMRIRLSLGASTGRLVQQRLIESLMLAAAGGAAGIAAAHWATAALAREVIGPTGQPLPSVFTPDARVVGFAAIVTVITALMFGLAPALRAVARGRAAGLVTTQRAGAGHATTGTMRALVIGQLALALVVVFSATLFGRTLINFMRIDPGFPADRLVVASFDPITSGYGAAQMPALSQRLLDAVRRLPGVRSAATSMCGLVTGCSSTSTYQVEGSAGSISLRGNWVSPDYFLTTGIPRLGGREFDTRDTAQGPRVAIVNEAFARRFFPGQSPIGRRIGAKGTPIDVEIVGLVSDARTQSLHAEPEPMAYFPIEQWGVNRRLGVANLDIRVDGDPHAVVSSVRAAIREAEPKLFLVNVTTMSAQLARDLSRERIVACLGFSFAALTLALAALGLYGVLSYGVAQRTQEIGVRMALGAGRSDVLRSVLGQSVRLALIGIAIGLAATVAVAGYLSTLLFGVTPLDPSTFVLVSVMFTAVTMLASYVPARRATRVDPLIALRAE